MLHYTAHSCKDEGSPWQLMIRSLQVMPVRLVLNMMCLKGKWIKTTCGLQERCMFHFVVRFLLGMLTTNICLQTSYLYYKHLCVLISWSAYIHRVSAPKKPFSVYQAPKKNKCCILLIWPIWHLVYGIYTQACFPLQSCIHSIDCSWLSGTSTAYLTSTEVR